MKPIEIDETEEMERITSLKHRETLIRGMGKKLLADLTRFFIVVYRSD